MGQALTVDDLRGERAKANVSQAALAKTLGIERRMLSAVERGQTNGATPEFVRRYLAALKVAPATRYSRRKAEKAS